MVEYPQSDVSPWTLSIYQVEVSTAPDFRSTARWRSPSVNTCQTLKPPSRVALELTANNVGLACHREVTWAMSDEAWVA